MSIDFLRPDYGLKNVTLDTERYERSFGDTKWFERPSEPVWNILSPPNSVVHNDEWESLLKTVGANAQDLAKNEYWKEKKMFMMPPHMLDIRKYGVGSIQAHRALLDCINEGDIEPMKDAMSTTCYNYVSGWLKHMKDLGYRLEHKCGHFERVERIGLSLLVVNDVTGDKKWKGPFVDDVFCSRIGRGGVSNISVVHWVKYRGPEEWTIKDSSGKEVASSGGSKMVSRILKFNTTATIYGHWYQTYMDLINGEADSTIQKMIKVAGMDPRAVHHVDLEKLDEQWQAKLIDIDNQVTMRSNDILTREKLFYSANTDQHIVWTATKAY